MPHSTLAFPFEMKIGGALAELSRRFTAGDTGLLLEIIDGDVSRVLCKGADVDFHAAMTGLKQATASYIVYDPFDASEYTWVSWENVGRGTMERVLDIRFVEEDFFKLRGDGRQQYASRWGVMF
jgi:hypothetical protein